MEKLRIIKDKYAPENDKAYRAIVASTSKILNGIDELTEALKHCESGEAVTGFKLCNINKWRHKLLRAINEFAGACVDAQYFYELLKEWEKEETQEDKSNE